MYTTASIAWHTNPRRVLRKRPRQQDHLQASLSRNLISTAMQHGAQAVQRAQRRRFRGYPRLTQRRTNKRTVPSRLCSQKGQKCAPKKASNLRRFFEKLFSDSRSAEGATQMAASPNHSIFTGSRATARIASYLQCRRPRGGINCFKKEGILCRETSAERRSEDGAFSLSWGTSWGSPRHPK